MESERRGRVARPANAVRPLPPPPPPPTAPTAAAAGLELRRRHLSLARQHVLRRPTTPARARNRLGCRHIVPRGASLSGRTRGWGRGGRVDWFLPRPAGGGEREREDQAAEDTPSAPLPGPFQFFPARLWVPLTQVRYHAEPSARVPLHTNGKTHNCATLAVFSSLLSGSPPVPTPFFGRAGTRWAIAGALGLALWCARTAPARAQRTGTVVRGRTARSREEGRARELAREQALPPLEDDSPPLPSGARPIAPPEPGAPSAPALAEASGRGRARGDGRAPAESKRVSRAKKQRSPPPAHPLSSSSSPSPEKKNTPQTQQDLQSKARTTTHFRNTHPRSRPATLNYTRTHQVSTPAGAERRDVDRQGRSGVRAAPTSLLPSLLLGGATRRQKRASIAFLRAAARRARAGRSGAAMRA